MYGPHLFLLLLSEPHEGFQLNYEKSWFLFLSSLRDWSFSFSAENSSQVIFQKFSGLAQCCCSESFTIANNESMVRLKLAEYASKLCLQQSCIICKECIILFSGLKKKKKTNRKTANNFLLGKTYTCFARVIDVMCEIHEAKFSSHIYIKHYLWFKLNIYLETCLTCLTLVVYF